MTPVSHRPASLAEAWAYWRRTRLTARVFVFLALVASLLALDHPGAPQSETVRVLERSGAHWVVERENGQRFRLRAPDRWTFSPGARYCAEVRVTRLLGRASAAREALRPCPVP